MKGHRYLYLKPTIEISNIITIRSKLCQKVGGIIFYNLNSYVCVCAHVYIYNYVLVCYPLMKRRSKDLIFLDLVFIRSCITLCVLVCVHVYVCVCMCVCMCVRMSVYF